MYNNNIPASHCNVHVKHTLYHKKNIFFVHSKSSFFIEILEKRRKKSKHNPNRMYTEKNKNYFFLPSSVFVWLCTELLSIPGFRFSFFFSCVHYSCEYVFCYRAGVQVQRYEYTNTKKKFFFSNVLLRLKIFFHVENIVIADCPFDIYYSEMRESNLPSQRCWSKINFILFNQFTMLRRPLNYNGVVVILRNYKISLFD